MTAAGPPPMPSYGPTRPVKKSRTDLISTASAGTGLSVEIIDVTTRGG
jgi:hypothetical protein